MKKALSLTLVLLLIVTLAACGTKSPDATEKPSDAETLSGTYTSKDELGFAITFSGSTFAWSMPMELLFDNESMAELGVTLDDALVIEGTYTLSGEALALTIDTETLRTTMYDVLDSMEAQLLELFGGTEPTEEDIADMFEGFDEVIETSLSETQDAVSENTRYDSANDTVVIGGQDYAK